ncbi:hypothetical protein GHO42_02480 [Pseudomonas sp. FSL R10-0056]|uniref:hypothetical protein n=1 Tax=unclassified Pseudomonas TaxID=196821 RepID=UPI001297FDAD|nr:MULTISPECIES: hypothetical protein [unclassified Pseudomonas]MQT61980.1 hypothetical protein [Pseudomonas sp. FSL R10-0056]MQT68661.1 hypothetical protein [Pseudomonas sp. FSL R10-0071]MQU47209.1 hypothetical protein [Pseudomonas sp. FSL A6-1183]
MPEVKLIGDVGLFGAAILQTPTPGQRHAALVFKDRSKKHLSLLHLAWHYTLKCDPLNAPYRSVPNLNFDEEELELFAEQASRLYDENTAGIPYGMEYTGASVFNGEMGFIDAPGAGLTCATFILGFFNSLGFDILDLSSWQSRDDDTLWQSNIYAALEPRLTAERKEAQKDLIGAAYRFRPEEVVGSFAIFESSPIDFSDAVTVGVKLLDEMHAK